MIVSEDRQAANLANAQLALAEGSVSPKPRRASAKNALKHGLSGAGAVLSEEDAAEIQRRYEAMMADMRPRSPAGEVCVWQMASTSYRAEKAAAYESAAIAMNVRNAAEAFDQERIEEAEAQFKALAEDPRRYLRKLRKSPEGVECLFDAWQELRSDLMVGPKGEWTQEHLEQAASMIGVRARHAQGSRFGDLSRALWGDFAGLKDDEAAGLDDEFRREWAKSALIELIEVEIAELREHYQTLDFEIIEADRAEAGQRALFDASKPAQLARRYESELRRGFYKALDEFRKVEAEYKARPEAPPSRPTPPPPPPSLRPEPKLGSFREMTPPPDREPSPGAPEAPKNEVSPKTDPENGPSGGGRPPKKPN